MLLAMLCLGSVAQAEVVQLSPDTYMISRMNGNYNISKLKTQVIKEANEFAQERGKVAIPISSQQRDFGLTGVEFEYQFRVISPDDPEAQRAALSSRPDVVVERRDTVTADIRQPDETPREPDLYSELLKLDDLRKRGLLTDAEFESEKEKLLRRSE